MSNEKNLPNYETAGFAVDKEPAEIKQERSTYRQGAINGLNDIINRMAQGLSSGGEDWQIDQDNGRTFRLTYCEVSDPANTKPCSHCNGTGLRVTHRDPRLN